MSRIWLVRCEDRIGTGLPRARTDVIYVDIRSWAISGSRRARPDTVLTCVGSNCWQCRMILRSTRIRNELSTKPPPPPASAPACLAPNPKQRIADPGAEAGSYFCTENPDPKQELTLAHGLQKLILWHEQECVAGSEDGREQVIVKQAFTIPCITKSTTVRRREDLFECSGRFRNCPNSKAPENSFRTGINFGTWPAKVNFKGTFQRSTSKCNFVARAGA